MCYQFVSEFFSQLFFTRVNSIFTISRSRILQTNDIPPLPSLCSSKLNGSLLSSVWNSYQRKCKDETSQNSRNSIKSKMIIHSLIRSLYNVYGKSFIGIGVLLATYSILSFSGPLFLYELVKCSETNASWFKISFYLLLLVISKIIVAILSTQYTYLSTELGVSISAALKDCVFSKTLKLSTSSRKHFNTGNITNLYTVDIERIVGAVVALNNLWVLPIQILLAMILLFYEVSYAMLAGLGTIIVILIANHYISLLQKAANDLTMTWKDNRMKLTTEVFNSMLIVKLNAWEDDFYDKIVAIRREELKYIWRTSFIIAFNICLLWMAPCLVSVSTIYVYAKILHYDISAAKIFTAMTLFRMLQDPLRALPNCITQLFQAISSIERLEEFYQLSEKQSIIDSDNDDTTLLLLKGMIIIPYGAFSWLDPMDKSKNTDKENSLVSKSSSSLFSYFKTNIGKRIFQISKLLKKNQSYTMVSDSSSHGDIEISDIYHNHSSEEMDSNSNNSNDINMTMRMTISPLHIIQPNRMEFKFQLILPSVTIFPGELMIITGSVGSGKSSLLAAILGEMYNLSSDPNSYHKKPFYSRESKIAYASQQSWIQNMSVRDNILFGLQFDKNRYEKVIDACVLHQDFIELPAYDMTEIGEKGLNLSGGQKARIALARAVYSDADIILLDDVLAALDPMVAKVVFDKCIIELLSKKTRIIVSHNEELTRHSSIDIIVTCSANDSVIFHRPNHSSYSGDHNNTTTMVSSSISTTLKSIESIDSIPYIILNPYKSREELAGYFEDNRDQTEGRDQIESIDSNSDIFLVSSIKKLVKNLSFSGRIDNADSYSPLKNSIVMTKVDRIIQNNINHDDNNRQHSGFGYGHVNGDGILSSEEDRKEGKIDANVYYSYIQAMGGFKVILFLIIVQTIWQCLSISSDLFLSYWTKESDSIQSHMLDQNILVYSILSISSGSIVLVRTITVSAAGYFSAKYMFENMLSSLLHAPMNWLDKNPSGRLLNRMSDDQAKVDCNIQFAFGSIFATGFALLGDLCTVMAITRYLIIAMIPIGYIYTKLTFLYLRASREIQRMVNISQSPIITLVSEVSEGVYTIRAFGKDLIERITIRNQKLIDNYSAVAHLAITTSCWFTLRIQLTASIVLLLIVILAFLCRNFVSPGLLGLCISYGLSLSNSLQYTVMQFAWFENSMVSPERIQQYIDIRPEGTKEQRLMYKDSDTIIFNSNEVDEEENNDDKEDIKFGIEPIELNFMEKQSHKIEISSSWPSQGKIVYHNVRFRYQPNGELVLKNVSLTIEGGEKIGIVGRTGSGKSSLTMSLFRIAELSAGSIYIDNIDISTIRLKKLRRAIEIVPQSPVLFKGSLRSCLDPFHEYSDEQIDTALEKSQLKSILSSQSIYANNSDSSLSKATLSKSNGIEISDLLQLELSENGNNLSVGERQMVILTRAILRGAKILVMDEATASIDHKTDQMIQTILKKEFKHSTVITIAHRIDTILDSDKILVMSSGEVVQYAKPIELLQKRSGIFYELACEGLGKDKIDSLLLSSSS